MQHGASSMVRKTHLEIGEQAGLCSPHAGHMGSVPRRFGRVKLHFAELSAAAHWWRPSLTCVLRHPIAIAMLLKQRPQSTREIPIALATCALSVHASLYEIPHPADLRRTDVRVRPGSASACWPIELRSARRCYTG